MIRIVGYEKNAESAKKEILSIVGELEQHVSQDVHIDRRVHPRLIGTKGRAINKVMSDYGVDIRFPKDADIVTVTGAQEKVEECIEYILNLEEEYVSDQLIFIYLLKYLIFRCKTSRSKKRLEDSRPHVPTHVDQIRTHLHKRSWFVMHLGINRFMS